MEDKNAPLETHRSSHSSAALSPIAGSYNAILLPLRSPGMLYQVTCNGRRKEWHPRKKLFSLPFTWSTFLKGVFSDGSFFSSNSRCTSAQGSRGIDIRGDACGALGRWTAEWKAEKQHQWRPLTTRTNYFNRGFFESPAVRSGPGWLPAQSGSFSF